MAADGEQLRTFPILIKDNGRVHDPDSRKSLRLKKGEQVQWVAITRGPWRIVFANSPFGGHNFVVNVGSPALSGEPTALGQFKYQVFLDGDEEPLDDPDIIIED